MGQGWVGPQIVSSSLHNNASNLFLSSLFSGRTSTRGADWLSGSLQDAMCVHQCPPSTLYNKHIVEIQRGTFAPEAWPRRALRRLRARGPFLQTGKLKKETEKHPIIRSLAWGDNQPSRTTLKLCPGRAYCTCLHKPAFVSTPLSFPHQDNQELGERMDLLGTPG